MKQILFLMLAVGLALPGRSQGGNGFAFVDRPDKKQVDLVYGGQLLTAYCYYDSSRKPILFPVNTLDGIMVTRGYPFIPVAGERTDHPHHSGIWLNYESVNGLDFWNNSTAIPLDKRDHYGTIIHQQVLDKKAGGNEASLTATATWVRPDGKVLLNEKTEYRFRVNPGEHNFIIDRTTTLTARDILVEFKDVKDGMFAIRVARELELPSKERSSFVDDKGNVTTVAPSGAGVTGMYYSSNGLKGDSVWGTQGTWVMLNGKKGGSDITIGMFDHPSNPGYPAYWHARGYGLFAVNPLGRKVFSNGKEELDFKLAPHQSTVFRYRIVVHNGSWLSREQMDRLSESISQ